MTTPTAILPPATLGILGGGQLGRFFVIAAHKLGYRVIVLDPDKQSPAGAAADEHIAAAYDDRAALEQLRNRCAAITTEFENVPAESLAELAKHLPVRPAAECVSVAQDRIAEKTFLRTNSFPCGRFVVIKSEQDIDGADGVFPGILKLSRLGYDGKGQARVENRDAAKAAFRQFQGHPCVLEQMLPLEREVSVILARGADGNIACFPISENQHRNGILDVSIIPARVDTKLQHEAESIARHIAEALRYVGTMAVEFFISDGKLLVNEMAPRPHNSGHYTIDACVTNQFEQQVRALCGLPLGSTQQHQAAVMINLLGDLWQPQTPDWAALLALPGVKLHLYGKREAKAGRKMGHVTVVAGDIERALATATRVRTLLGLP